MKKEQKDKSKNDDSRKSVATVKKNKKTTEN